MRDRLNDSADSCKSRIDLTPNRSTALFTHTVSKILDNTLRNSVVRLLEGTKLGTGIASHSGMVGADLRRLADSKICDMHLL
ncbi:MAG: hypothetical protein ABS82_02735 [Rhodanobacter sp. SCN 67-45]|nr:MAG: hypothetical protein ABS82_02735 [Rhodanobacter sp. SCN 67-45]